MLKPQKEDDMAEQPGFGARLRDKLCFQSLLGFFFHKGVRVGPRIFLNLAGVLAALFVIAKLVPLHMTESTLESIPHNLWSSIGGDNSADDASTPGGLRIVVFGEIDIGTPVGQYGEDGSKSWTQALCAQLECTKHVSMVPSPDTTAWSVSSNELYSHGVEKVFNETAEMSTPGMDYSYLSKYYAPQWKSRDLKEQIDEFLGMPKPRYPPEETLWVFSFGLWDVWSLSALPIPVAKESVDAMTSQIFEQIERLYAASTNPESIAWSDINSVQAPALPTNATEEKDSDEAAAAESRTEKRDEESAEEGDAAHEEEKNIEPVETFRILIPRIMDPSLLPGWRDLRPRLPAVHSEAEQMRNSAELTEAWNDGIVNSLSDWVMKENEKPGEKQKKQGVHDDASEGYELPTKNKRAEDETATITDAELAAAAAELPDRSPREADPLRDGFAYNLADYLLDQMVERQMRDAHLKDASGRGDAPVVEGFRVVKNACVQPIDTVPLSVSVQSGVTLNIPNRKIGKDVQVPDIKAPGSEAAKAGSNIKRSSDSSEKQAGLAAQMSGTVKVCPFPSDYLFYTPFALSQRAIEEVASQTAEMIRKEETVRAKLQL